MDLPLNLSLEEINFILSTLGELPNKSNSYPVLVKIKQQADAAINAQSSVSTPPLL